MYPPSLGYVHGTKTTYMWISGRHLLQDGVIFAPPPPSNIGAKSSCRQYLPGKKNIILLAPGVGNSSPVQDNNCILPMLVHKIQP